MSKPKRDQALEQAIDEAGGPVAVARFITEHYEPITAQAVSKWKRCPPMRVKQVEQAVRARRGKIRARDLCPEIFEAKAA